MTKAKPMPTKGGSYTRDAKGKLERNVSADAQTEKKPAAAKPAAPDKEA